MVDLRETRADVLSPRTLKIYDDLWRLYLLPIVGPVRLSDLTIEVVRSLTRFTSSAFGEAEQALPSLSLEL